METHQIAASLRARPWLRRLAYALGGLLALWALAWVAVPPLLKSQVEKIASEKLGRKLTLGAVDFKPWTLELELRDVALGGALGQGEQLRIGRAYVDAELQSLMRLAPVIDSVQIEGVRGNVVHLGGGKYDFDDILARLAVQPKAEKASDELPRFAIYNIALSDVTLGFDDRPVGKKHAIKDLQISLPFLSTLAAQRDVKTQPRLAFALNGSRFDSSGESTPFVQTRKTDAKISIRALDLAPYLPYLPADLPVNLVSAVLGADLTLAFEQTPKPTVRITGQVQADNLALQDAAKAPLLAMKNLSVVAKDMQPLAGIVILESITFQSPQMQLRRNGAGQLNFLAAEPSAIKKEAPRADSAPANSPKGTEKLVSKSWLISVERVTLKDGSVTWADETTQPRAAIAAQSLNIEARQIAWPFAPDKPIQFEGSSQVAQGSLTFNGTATDAQASVTAQLSGLPLAQLAPYLGGVLTPALTGVADVQAGLLWQAGQGAQKPALQITLPKAQVANAQLTQDKQGKSRLAQVKLLSLEGGQIDLIAQTVNLAKIAASGVQTRVERSETGRWIAQDWFKAAPAANSKPLAKEAAASKPWKITLGEINLDAPQLSFIDRAASAGAAKAVLLEITQLKAKVSGFELDGDKLSAKPMPISLGASLAQAGEDSKPAGEAGKIDIKGLLTLAPLSMQLDAKLSRLPIHAFEPYFADALNIDLLRLEAGFVGKLQLAQTPQGMQIKISGDALAEELQTTLRGAALAASSGAVAGDELLSWKALNVKALAVEMNPGAALKVELGEAALTDFFARILVSEQGRINLADIVKSSASTPDTTKTIAPRADSTPAGSTISSQNAASSSPEPLISIGAISLINGKVYFSDRFIKPNYAANLSELTGRLSAFSSQPVAGTVQMADLELRGKAEGTASLEILGKLNPLAKPLALDIAGKVRDLELAPLSPYSVKYAGHGIERGKLSVDVAYLVKPDGQLTASNKIVLNQIKFGDKVEGAPNSLPVKLAVALLADRNGVIDINLPIQGSINDPQFSIGPIVFKLIINLVVKAITSPFSLLASAFGGGGDELGQVSFQPGSAALVVAANPGLEKVANAMQDRPNLKMTVIGQASLDVEREGYKKERLKALVAAEKRRSAVAAGSSGSATQTAAITVSEAEYPALLKEVYKRSDVPKPRNAIGLAKDIAVAEMEALLLASLPATEQAMQELALARGVAVRDHLASLGLPSDRLFLGAAKAVAKDDKWSPRAELGHAVISFDATLHGKSAPTVGVSARMHVVAVSSHMLSLETSMKTTHILAFSGIATALCALSGAAFAQEQGRVISTTPVITQVAVPRQVCSNEQVTTQTQQKSGAGALMGGIAGGAMGNAVGNGSGRAAATMIGIFGGAILGDKIEGGQPQANTQNVQRCTTQTFYENRPTAYNVVYEFNGKQYQVQLPQDPGPFVSLQVTPVGGAPVAPVQQAPVIVRPVTQAPVYTPPVVYTQPVYTQPVVIESYTTYVQPAPVYVRPAPVFVTTAPVYYGRPYHHHPHPYRPYGSGVSIGYSGHFR
jgi:uncharacterized protein YcfJ